MASEVNTMITKTEKENNNKIDLRLLLAVSVYASVAFGLLGAFFGFTGDSFSPLSGFIWGIGVGITVLVVSGIGMLGWEWIKKEADRGKLLPYMLCGIGAAIVISGFLATQLGQPSCDETDDAPYSSCTQYADDGFEATSTQRWDKFWKSLPITIIICLLIAYIAHGQAEKNRPKHFKSEEDRFAVDIFPEMITVDLDEDGNSYKYRTLDGTQYIIDIMPLDDLPKTQHRVMEAVESWHKQVVSAATTINPSEVDCRKGITENTQYVFGSYPLEKEIIYYHLTLIKFGNVYGLSMYIQPYGDTDKKELDEMFFKFVDSFRFI